MITKPIEETIPLLLQNGWKFSDDNILSCGRGYVYTPKYLQDNALKEIPGTSLPDYLFKEVEI